WLYTPTVDLPRATNPPQSLKSHWFLYAPNGQWPLAEDGTEWLGRNDAWSVEGQGSGLLVYIRSKRAPHKALRAWADEGFAQAQEFARRVPDIGLGSAEDGTEHTPVHEHVFHFKASWKI